MDLVSASKDKTCRDRSADRGTDFENILKCFLYTLKRLNRDFWLDRGDEYPQFVFAAVKDNPSFARLLKPSDISEKLPWYLLWFTEYAWSIWGVPTFKDVLAKMVDFLCRELQHERFKDTKPLSMSAVSKVFSFNVNICYGRD